MNFFYLSSIIIAIATAMELDIFIPAFPCIIEEWGISEHEVSMLITSNFIGLMIAGFIVGPLSDRYGRLKVLIPGMFLFTLSSFQCMNAVSFNELLCWRFIQGLGASCGVSLVFVMAMDSHNEVQANSWVSFLNGAITASMVAAPLLGNVLQIHYGWRSNFLCITILGGLALLSTFFIKETLMESKQVRWSLLKVIKTYKQHYTNLNFISLSSIPSVFYGCLIIYVTYLPLILINHLGIPKSQYGWYHGVVMAAYCVASIVSSIVQRYISFVKIKNFGLILIGLSSVALILIRLYRVEYHLSVWITIIMSCYSGAAACAMSAYIVKAYTVFPDRGIVGSSLSGIKLGLTSGMMGVSALIVASHLFNILYLIAVSSILALVLCLNTTKLESRNDEISSLVISEK